VTKIEIVLNLIEYWVVVYMRHCSLYSESYIDQWWCFPSPQ